MVQCEPGEMETASRSAGVVHETYYLEGSSRRPKSKRVTVYDMIHEKFPQFFPENDKTSRFKKAAVQRANHIICISENTRADLIELLGVTRDRTSVVHLAHTVHRRTEGPTNRVADRPITCLCGARDGYKNFADSSGLWPFGFLRIVSR